MDGTDEVGVMKEGLEAWLRRALGGVEGARAPRAYQPLRALMRLKVGPWSLANDASRELSWV